MQIKTGWSTSPPIQLILNDEEAEFDRNENANLSTINNDSISLSASQLTTNQTNKKEIKPINKLTTTIKSSASKSIKIKNKPQHYKLDDCSYDSLLQSYSSEANLCSTPEIREIYMPTGAPTEASLSKCF